MKSGWWRRVDARHFALLAAGVIVAYLALVPVGTMIFASLRSAFLSGGVAHWTVSNFPSTYTSTGFGRVVTNSFVYAGASSVAAIVLGFALAWLVSRTNTPAKGLAYAAALFPLILPGILGTMAWTLLLSPRGGVLNLAFQTIHLPTFNIYSLPGMIFVETMHLAPLAFLMGVAAFATLDNSLEEAALSCGAPAWRIFRSITLPLIRPALATALMLMFILAISTFEVPQLIGVPGHDYVFASEIYAAANQFPPSYASIGVIGVSILAIAAVGLFLSQRVVRRSRTQTIRGKAFQARASNIGRWRWLGLALFVLVAVVTMVLPFLMLVWSSLVDGYQTPSIHALHHLTLTNFSSVLSTPALVSSIRNSFITAIVAAAVVTLISVGIAYLTIKTKIKGRGVLDLLSMVPIAVPGIIVGVGILFWYLVIPVPLHLYGTLAILVIAFVTIGLPYGVRYMTAGINQIHDELEEAAATSGASWRQAFFRIYLPLLKPSLLASFVYVLMLAFREVSGVILLYTNGNQVLSVALYNLWITGDSYPLVAALGIIMTAMLAAFLLIVRLLGVRTGRIALPGSSRGGVL